MIAKINDLAIIMQYYVMLHVQSGLYSDLQLATHALSSLIVVLRNFRLF